MRRILAATLTGVLTGSLLTTVEPLLHSPPPAVALTDSDCTPDVTVANGTIDDGSDGEPDQVGGNSSYVDAYAVDSDGDGTEDECALEFKDSTALMTWNHGDTESVHVFVLGGGGSGGVSGGGAGGYYDTTGTNSGDGKLDISSWPAVNVEVGAGGASVESGDQDVGVGGEKSRLWDSSSNPPASIGRTSEFVVVSGGGAGGLTQSLFGGANGFGSSTFETCTPTVKVGAGGDGAGGQGEEGSCSGGPKLGAGGIGKTTTISGTLKFGGGGRGGWIRQNETINYSNLAHPSEFGGGSTPSSPNLRDGRDNSGGGGSGFGDDASGAGGSGIVIVRFAPPPVDPAPVLGSVVRTDGGFTAEVTNVGLLPSGVTFSGSVASGSEGSTPTVSLSGSTVTVSNLKTGESAVVTVTASKSGFSPSSGSITGVAKASQASLSITGSDDLRFGGSISVAASGGSGSGDVTFGLSSGDCVLDTDTLVLSSDGSGMTSCVVTATRAGDANFLASTEVSKTFAIGKADRFVSFTSSVPADPRVGDTYEPSAEATGGGSVSFAAAGSCSIASGVVTFNSEGTCTITASSGSDTNYLAATNVTQVIEVGLANQTITFDAVADKDFDDRPFQLSATSSRGLDVSFSTSPAACSVTTGGVVSIDATGLCEVTASQAGVSGQIAAASDVTRAFRVQAVVPGAPRLTSVGFGDGSLTVGFVAPEYVGGGTLSAYRAVATDGAGNEFVNNDCGTTSPCTVDGLTNGTDYTVTVAAVNEAGAGPVSNTSPAIKPAARADAVSALSTVPGDGNLAVSWTKPDLGGATFTSYEVTVFSNGAQVDSSSITDSVDTTSATFSGLTNGTAYDVKVVTITSANTTEITGNTAETTGVPAVVPSVVRDAEAVLVGNTGAFVSWATPVSTGGLPVTSYAVTPESLSCSSDAVLELTVADLDDGDTLDTFCEITGLARGRSVSISVAAVNSIGAGDTVTVSVTTPAVPSSGGGDDDEEETVSPVPSSTPASAGGPGRGVGRGVPGGPAGDGGTAGGVTLPGSAPPTPGGVPGVPTPPERPTATAGGVPVPTTTTPTPGGRGVSVSAGGVDVGVDVPDPGDGRGGVVDRDGTPEPVVTPGQGKTVSGGGAAPGTVVEVWLPGRGNTGPTNVAQIPVGADGSFTADIDLFADSDQPLPIGRNVLQVVTTNAEGEQILVDMPFTLDQGTPRPEVLRETGQTPDAPADGVITTNQGQQDTARIITDSAQGTVTVDAQTWAFAISVDTTTSRVDGTDQTTTIVSAPDSDVTITGSGFMADTRVDVWAFSTPTLLGNATVDSDGSVTVTINLNTQSMELGAHTLQLQAVGMDGYIRTANLPVTLTDSAPTTTDSATSLLGWAIGLIALIVLAAIITTLIIRRRNTQQPV